MTKIYNEFGITTNDGLDLYGQGWFPEVGPDKNIIFIHGIGEHSNRYIKWANRCTKKNMGFFIIDLRGHGKSDGPRGHIPSLKAVLDDIEMFVQYVKDAFPLIPPVLYGHSMGGNLVINYLLKRSQDFKAAIATSPWIRIPFDIPALKMGLAKFANTFIPSFVQPSGLETSFISRDENIVKEYNEDPDVHDKISARLFMELYMSGLLMPSQSTKIELPMLVMHGTGDQITSWKASEEFVKKGKDNLQLKLWDGFYHELHNEPERKQVFEYAYEWLQNL